MTWVARILFIGMSIAALWLLFGCQSMLYPHQTTVLTARGVEIPFHLAVAETDEQKEKGLSFRTYVPKDSGMIFTSERPKIWHMWMKDTQVSLDMLFFDENGKIVKVAERAAPFSLKVISSDVPVKGVLEINGGLSSYLGIKPGDKITVTDFE